MQFSIQREALLKPLQQVVGVVERRQTLPVLANLLVKVADGKLSLTGTDLEVEMTATTEAEKLSDGEITIPARKLFDIVRALPDGAKIELAKALERRPADAESLARIRSVLSELKPRLFRELSAEMFDRIQDPERREIMRQLRPPGVFNQSLHHAKEPCRNRIAPPLVHAHPDERLERQLAFHMAGRHNGHQPVL